VAHTCNPSYSGGRDQEDRSWKPAWANISVRPYIKKTLHKKRAGGVAQGVGPDFKPQYHQENKINKYNRGWTDSTQLCGRVGKCVRQGQVTRHVTLGVSGCLRLCREVGTPGQGSDDGHLSVEQYELYSAGCSVTLWRF
jgi:hypothetical protein